MFKNRTNNLPKPAEMKAVEVHKSDIGVTKRKKKKRSLSAISSLTLEHEWTLYYDERNRSTGMHTNAYARNITKVGSFRTIQDFWRYWNSLKDPSQFPLNSNLRLFKSNIKPLWEDPMNKDGGKWVISCNKADTSKLWMQLTLALIGEQFKYGEQLCGLVLSIRPNKDSINLWRTSPPAKRAEKTHAITNTHLQNLIGAKTSILFKKHQGAIEYNKQMIGAKKHSRRHSSGGRERFLRNSNSGLSRYPSQPNLKSGKSKQNNKNNVYNEHNKGRVKRALSSSAGLPYSDEKKVSFDKSSSIDSGSDEEINFELEQNSGGHRKSRSFSNSPFGSSPSYRSHRKSRSDATSSKIFHRPPTPQEFQSKHKKSNSATGRSSSWRKNSGTKRIISTVSEKPKLFTTASLLASESSLTRAAPPSLSIEVPTTKKTIKNFSGTVAYVPLILVLLTALIAAIWYWMKPTSALPLFA